jgi:hypothetical protein
MSLPRHRDVVPAVVLLSGGGPFDRDETSGPNKPLERGWTDELLDAELAHRHTEVELLAADIEDRRTGGGPHTRQVLADNAELSERAEKIVPAQQAQTAADEILAERRRLDARKQNLQWQLAETPRHRMLARSKLRTQITETEGALEDLTPKVTAAETAAKAAAKATGV